MNDDAAPPRSLDEERADEEYMTPLKRSLNRHDITCPVCRAQKQPQPTKETK